jgi:uncharacterized protein with HEPN domain
MLSNTGRDALTHIGYYIDLISSFVDGYDFPRFAADPRTFHAVTRCLEIISEASRRVPAEVKARHPSTPWRQMADAGNKYRHEYEDVAERVVWATVQDALPSLRTVIRLELGPEG